MLDICVSSLHILTKSQDVWATIGKDRNWYNLICSPQIVTSPPCPCCCCHLNRVFAAASGNRHIDTIDTRQSCLHCAAILYIKHRGTQKCTPHKNVHFTKMHTSQKCSLHKNTIYCRALNYTVPNWNALYYTVMHCTALHCAALNCTVLYCT